MGDKTNSDEELLEVCLHDLKAAREVITGALLQVADSSRAELASIVRTIHETYSAETGQLANLGAPAEGDPNLWMKGIAEDALRDTRSVCPGKLLDTALIGAVRKALAADEVSLKTAQAVAQALGKGAAADGLEDMRKRNRESDSQLVELLAGLYAVRSD